VGTLRFTVTRVNHPPVAQNQSVTADEDTSIIIMLFTTDADGDSLTYQIVTPLGTVRVTGTPSQFDLHA